MIFDFSFLSDLTSFLATNYQNKLTQPTHVRNISDLRQSRQSLVSHFDGRQSRASKRSLHRQPSRSRSRDRLTAGGPGYLGDPRDNDSLGEDSDNWAGTSTDNNWTDYDQDIYMHRNPTHKFGTRPGFGRDDVNL